jgi:hypothetical protein
LSKTIPTMVNSKPTYCVVRSSRSPKTMNAVPFSINVEIPSHIPLTYRMVDPVKLRIKK